MFFTTRTARRALVITAVLGSALESTACGSSGSSTTPASSTTTTTSTSAPVASAQPVGWPLAHRRRLLWADDCWADDCWADDQAMGGLTGCEGYSAIWFIGRDGTWQVLQPCTPS